MRQKNGIDNMEYMETDVKQLLEEQRKTFAEDVKGYIGVLVEDFDSKIKLISEQYKSVMEVLKEHIRQIEEMKTQIMEINVRLTEMNIRLGHVEDNLRRKIDFEDFERLEKRVALLEAR